MLFSDILSIVAGGVVLPGVAVLALRVWGYRVDIKIKPIKRRRPPIEPDEHTAFL